MNSVLTKGVETSFINNMPGLIAYWDFSGDQPLASKGPNNYTLKEGNGTVQITNEALLAGHAADLQEGQYFYISRSDCPELNIHGREELTVMAWIKRAPKSYIQCEAIAGMWNETMALRQYCLFLNLQLFDSADQVCGHISGVGGATPNEKWCIDASIGQTPVEYDSWHFVAFTYNQEEIQSYLDGRFDPREHHNPYPYREGIFDGGEKGSNFTVGAVHRLGEMGNNFVGKIAGLAVVRRALGASEISDIYIKSGLSTH